MESRTLGRTGLSVTRLGLGLAALGRPGYMNLGHAADLAGLNRASPALPDEGREGPALIDRSALEARTHQVLDAALALGVRYFDAARSYGEAEAFVASWLGARALPPGAVTVGSKWGYTYTAAWRTDAPTHEVKDHRLATLLGQLRESRQHLGRHLQLYQIHSATLESGVLEDREVRAALAALRSDGLAIGLSLSGARQADTLRRALELDLFDCVQATWNLLERSVEPALAEAHAAGLGVIVKEPLANGRLAGRDQAERLRPLRDAAARAGVGPDALALAAVLARPWADVVLSGAATVEQLRENGRALEVRWDDALERALAPLVEPAETYWRERGQLAWS